MHMAFEKVSGVIFDLDGVLVDSWKLAQQALRHAFLAHGMTSEPPLREFRLHLGAPLEKILADLGLPFELKSAFESYARREVSQVTVFPGVREMLHALSQGDYGLAVLTGKSATRAAEVLQVTRLAEYFDVVVTPDDAPGKPDPAGPVSCLIRMGQTADNVLLVGDSPIDMQSARAAHIRAIFARWGANIDLSPDSYDYKVESPEGFIRLVMGGMSL